MKRSPICLSFVFALGLSLALILLWLLGSELPSALADGTIRYVAPGAYCAGSTPCYATVQEAVDASAAGDEIRIAAGVYTTMTVRPRNDIVTTGNVTQVVYLTKTVTIRGGYTTTNWTTSDPVNQPTILNAQGRGRVIYVTGDISPTIEGLRLTNGNAAGLGGLDFGAPYDAGGGVYIIRASATLSRCQVYNNVAGVANTVGGGVHIRAATARLYNNRLFSNTAQYGGGLFADQGAPTLSGNTVATNTGSVNGGGVYLFQSAAALDGSIIFSNTASSLGGGLVFYGSNAVLTNTVIADNRAATNGSGVYVSTASSPRLLHTTIARNTGGDGSGLYVDASSTVALTNTILTSQTVGIYVATGGAATLESTLWNGNTTNLAGNVSTGTHNYTGNPGFVNANAGNYHLATGSAAIDRGVNAGVATDIDGEPRPLDATPDLGADEYSTGCYARAGSSPIYTTIQAAVDAATAGNTVKVAGYCAGVQARAGTNQTVYISKTLTIQGGYTLTDWMTSNPIANPTTLDAQGNGRVVVMTGTVSVSLESLRVTNGRTAGANEHGGGIYAVNATVAISNSVVLSNTTGGAGSQGGGLYADQGLALTNTQFLSNTSPSNGGGVYAANIVTLAGGLFQNNRSTGNNGGGLYANSGLTLADTQFISNTAPSLGGGAYVAGVAQLTGGLFQINRSTANSGGGLYVNNTLTLIGTQFISNAASSSGGGVYAVAATLINGRIENNNCTGGTCQGGGLFTNGTLALTDTQFLSNTAVSHGGAAYGNGATTLAGGYLQNNRCTGGTCRGGGLDANGTLTLSGTQFISNTSGGNGGGAYAGGVAQLSNARFQINRSTGSSGGGLYANNTLTLSETPFVSNTAAVDGGGAYVNGSATLVGGLFQNNQSSNYGGGLYVFNTLTLTGTQFLSNTIGAIGGGVHVSGGATVTGGRFENNRCTNPGCWGGGFYADKTLALTGTQFFGNTATGDGGAFYLGNGAGSRLVNALFARNAAGGDGAAMYLLAAVGGGGSADIVHATVTSPTVGTGQAIYVGHSAATVNVTNTIVASYTTGIQRAGGTVNTVNEDYNLFFGNTNNIQGTVGSGGHSLADLAPVFVNQSSDDYHLGVGSAAIDNGADIGVTTDFEGDTRPQGHGFDIGCDESSLSAEADLQIAKTVTPTLADPGQPITYTLILANNGPYLALGVVITDSIPVSVTGTSVVSDGVALAQVDGTRYVWRTQLLALNQRGVITITGVLSNPLPGGILTNTATIAARTVDSNDTNNSSDAGVDVLALGANLSVAKIASPEPAIAGQPLTYTIIITNNSLTAANGVTLSDTLPPSTTLLLLDQTDDHAYEFEAGTFVNTAWHEPKPYSRWLAITNTSLLAGTFTSRVMDGVGPVAWDTLEWEPLAPYWKELPGSQQVEIEYARGRADMSGNRILLHLNESAGASLFSDSSGLGNHATCSDCPTAGVAGRFNTASSFDGAGNSAVVTDTTNLSEYTIEAWVNLASTADASIIYRADITGTLASHRLGVSGGRFVHTLYDGMTRTITGTTVAATGVWYHVAGVVTNNGDMRLYVNGEQEAGTSDVGSPWAGGDRYLLGVGLNGSLDEVAVFSRALSSSEIADHYKRGALRVAFQVRSCDDALCSGEGWLGPDGTSATYYSELLNTTLGLPSSSITVADQRYFQYKAFLYTDDTALSPELRWVHVLPDHRRIAPSQGSCVAPDAQSFTCDVGTIAGSGVVSVTAYVDVDPWALGLITNTVWVSATNAPSGTVETVSTVVEQADLRVHKDDYSDPVNPGSALTYTISVHNDGPSAARSLTLTDTLPISVVNVTPNHGWSCDRTGNTITCTLASIGPGDQWDSVVVSGLAPMISGTITNTVWLTATTPETDASDNTHDETTLVVPLSDLVIVKSANPDPVDPSSTLTYVLTVTNNGPYTATSIVVNDWLPSSVTWGGGAGCTHDSGVVTCTVASLNPLASTTFNLNVTTPLTGFLVNMAQVTSAVRDPDTSNNSTYAYAAILPVADLSIVKSDNPDPVYAGLPLTYTLTFSNAGPTAAGTLTTTLAFSNVFGISIPDSGHAYPYPSVIPVSSLAGDVQNVLVTLADLDHSFPNDLSILLVGPGGQSVVLMSGVSSSSRLTDSVTLTFDDAAASVLPPTDVITSGVYRPTNYGAPGSLPSPAPSGPYGGSLSAFRGATPNGDWKLYVMDWVEEDAGSIGSWSLQLTVVADGVVTVTDNLPTGMTSGNVTTPAGWTCQSGGTVTCVAPRLEMNAPASIVVTATAPVAGGVITNTATITSTTADSDVALNTAQITTTVIAQVDLQIGKSVSPDPVLAGQLLTYTLTFTNAGPSQITSAVITDTLPANATVASAPGCAPAGSKLTCAVAVPAVNTPASLVIVVNAPPDAGVITNTAEIAAAAVIELAPLDNTAWVTSTVTPSADLVIVKSDSPDPVAQGGNIVYTVVVSNNGPSVAMNVVLTDSVPTSTTFQSLATAAGWSCTTPAVGGTGNVVCTNPSLTAGASATFTLTVQVHAGTPNGVVIGNSATVSSDTSDPTTPNVATASTTVGLYKTYLPIIARNYAFAPDLVVASVSVSSGSAQIVVKNQGDAAVPVNVDNEFWVDLYINPTTPPTAVNQTRETLGCQGAVWGVTVDALPQLAPGGVLTLTLNDAHYWPSRSNMPATLPAGTPIYAQVDSANTSTNYGAVLENHEITGLPYNNITSAVSGSLVIEQLTWAGEQQSPSPNLPPRP